MQNAYGSRLIVIVFIHYVSNYRKKRELTVENNIMHKKIILEISFIVGSIWLFAQYLYDDYFIYRKNYNYNKYYRLIFAITFVHLMKSFNFRVLYELF